MESKETREKIIVNDLTYRTAYSNRNGSDAKEEFKCSRIIQSYTPEDLLKSKISDYSKYFANEVCNNIKSELSSAIEITPQQEVFYKNCTNLFLNDLNTNSPILIPVKCGFGKSSFIKSYISTIIGEVKRGSCEFSKLPMIIATDRVVDLKSIQKSIEKKWGYYHAESVFGDIEHDEPDYAVSYVYVMESWNKDIECPRPLKDYKERKDLIMPAAVVMVSLVLFVLQKDLGTALIFFAIAITMVYIGTAKFRYVMAAILLFIVGAVASYYMFSHVQARVDIWIDPWKTASGSGYQIVQSLYAIASGGFWGTGLYLGHPNYIPEVQTDFIFSIICEEFGLLGGFAIVLTYFLLIYRGFRAAIYSSGTFSRMVAVGVSTMVGAQVFIIIGGVTKLIPMTGITLPLVSYGGSSMIINFIALGLVQKVSEADAA
jgi:cell division protein FtsW (lipid II flippase)